MNGEISGGKNGIVTGRNEIFLAAAMLVTGFLYWNLIKVVSLGAGISIFFIIISVVIFIYFKVNGIRQNRNSLICLGITALSAANFFMFDNVIIKLFNFLFLSVSFIYWVCLSARNRIDEKLSVYIIGDLFNQLIIIPFGNMACLLVSLKGILKKNENGKGIINAVIGILIILPVLILVVNLLAEADAAFEYLIDHIHFSLSESMIQYILQALFGIPVACYLFGSIYGNIFKRKTDILTLKHVDQGAKALEVAPGSSVNTALTALNIIYLIFFLSQTTYLFSAFANNIPSTMTYAEYARRGFFELCTIAGINLFVLTIAHILIKKEANKSSYHKLLKIETTALCLFTTALILTAFSKMFLYISSYGLTQLRVLTSWFMILLFVLFVIIAIRQYKVFNGFRTGILSFVILFMILCFGNIDGMIAKYNIDRYNEGTLEHLDVDALTGISDGAVPYLYKLYNETEDEELRDSLKDAILGGTRNDTDFRDFNLQRYNADKLRAVL